MSSYKYSLVSAIFVVLTGTALEAQSLFLRATVPFDFHAGRTVLPAGEYLVTEQGRVVILKSAGRGAPGSILLTNGASSRSNYGASIREQPRVGRLEFDHFGSEYFLTAVWSPFDPEGS